ncbi:hypothetical protein ACWGSE_24240 [Streptomyces diastaticus]|uniref:hypothetical protein n=1 Tax=Streptomyces TaxID=1883 RepID=UPI000C264946|nr:MULTISPECIES: hypothetical protein [unclassified Streptomyces]MBL3805032.1 hypothetical protein [Streptomyces sp. BRB081]PJM80646.1 hypothetical protein CH313_27050 [Streptomyces sp. TSRI0384-2]RPK79743.1 hypothetical protein EES47_29265 [Streptomyces sp. ADI98-12]
MTSPADESPLRGVAQNAEASARYLADIQRTLMNIGRQLETLQHETRVHLRGTHVEGDRWKEAHLRALPVEAAMKKTLRDLKKAVDDLERVTFKRRAHQEKVNALPAIRKEKQLAKARKKNPTQIQAAPGNPSESTQGVSGATGMGYGNPASIHDLKRKSA